MLFISLLRAIPLFIVFLDVPFYVTIGIPIATLRSC